MASRTLPRLAVAIVIVHFVVSVIHGTAHDAIAIPLERWQNVYIYVVITFLPIGSALWIWRRDRGYAILAASMLGALLFGIYYHYIAEGADNVASVVTHAAGERFRVTAALLAIIEAAGVAVGLIGASRRR